MMLLKSLLNPIVKSNHIITYRCIRTAAEAELEAQEMLDKLYSVVKAQRFRDIVVIQTKFDADPRYLILASGFNSRHLVAATEAVNKEYKYLIKTREQDFAHLSISQEWNVMDFKSVVLHLFLDKTRNHFDIEQLWTVGEEYDDLVRGDSLNT